MNDSNNIINIIENLNYIYLLENNKHKNIDKKKLIINTIKTLNFQYAINRLLNKKNKIDHYAKQNNDIIPLFLDNNKKRIAIYTCITGNYDKPYIPYVIESNCDYFLYTDNVKDNEHLKVGNIWQVKNIPDNILKLKDKVLINRYIKMHPHELFGDSQYDYAIYIDGNISIVSNISSFCDKVSSKTGLAFHKHYNKKCAYDEIKTCEIVGKGNLKDLKNQEKKYKKEGFPINFGLFECNVIVSDLKNKISSEVLNNWWKEFISSKSMRDQISFPYSLWKNNYDANDIGIIENNVFLNKKIRINKHL